MNDTLKAALEQYQSADADVKAVEEMLNEAEQAKDAAKIQLRKLVGVNNPTQVSGVWVTVRSLANKTFAKTDFREAGIAKFGKALGAMMDAHTGESASYDRVYVAKNKPRPRKK